MKGTKRLAVSESAEDGGDTTFWTKRALGGSPFERLSAEPAQQKTTIPSLDMHRAESSRQHVRALNTQFASWVQTQLKNHPDELWEDGVRDYLSHASDIMKKFSDVVNWLTANAAGGGSTAESLAGEKKIVPESKDNGNKLFPEKAGFAPVSANTTFTTSWRSGMFSNNQSSGGFSSNQNSSLFLNSQGSAGVASNSQSSGEVFSVSQPSNVFGLSQSSSTVTSNNHNPAGVFSGSPNSNVFGICHSSSPLTSNNQSSGGLFSTNQSSSAFSNSQGTRLFSNSQSSGFSSNSQSSEFFPSSQSTGLFSNSLNTGAFSSSQTPNLFGLQGSAPSNLKAAAADDDEEEIPQPSSPSVKKAEETGIVVVHEVKCKLYVKSSDPADKDAWKDKGTGQLSIKTKEGKSKGAKESKPTIVVRNEVGKVLLNALLYPGIKTNAQKNSIVAIFHTSGDDGGNSDAVVARTFLIRTKNEEERTKLATAIQEYAPSS